MCEKFIIHVDEMLITFENWVFSLKEYFSVKNFSYYDTFILAFASNSINKKLVDVLQMYVPGTP